VQLVISDQHTGLVAAIKRCFQGASHQRCRVHYVERRIMWSRQVEDPPLAAGDQRLSA